MLLLSGIGPADELSALGITPRLDLPGVGRNLQDHASVFGMYQASGPFTFDQELRLDRMALSVLRWKLFGTGPVGDLPVGIQGFVRTDPSLDRPDVQCLVSPVAMDAKVWFPGWRKRRGDYFSVSSVLLHPESRGRVSLRSPNPQDAPRIRFNLLQAEADILACRRFVRLVRDLFAETPAAQLVSRELFPGPAVQSDAEIDQYLRTMIRTAMHPTSTCAMGVGPDAVVDAALRVRGIERLRIADASVMPLIPGGNTNAPAMMIAEKAADLIKHAQS